MEIELALLTLSKAVKSELPKATCLTNFRGDVTPNAMSLTNFFFMERPESNAGKIIIKSKLFESKYYFQTLNIKSKDVLRKT